MKKKRLKITQRICFMNMLVLMLSIFCFNSISYAEGVEKSMDDGPRDSKEIENFSDKFFYENMKKSNVPGAAIVVVRDGKVIFKKGYGYANIEKKIPVDPDKTVFRNGSVGKLFTATAIMQLNQKGLINLDDNVNNYLSTFKVNNKFSKAVTFGNIMTHSSGLDSGSEVGGASRSKTKQISYEEYMKSHIPMVINEPGTITNYSNSGYNLLGYLIEKVSGMSYESYMEKNIFQPLNMKNSNVVSRVENMATAYNFEKGSFKAIKDTGYGPSLGCGSINSTVVDTANFMIAHLQNGKFQGNEILNENTAKLMYKQQFTNSSELPGMGYSFIENYKNNQKIIKHEGAVPGFVTSLFLMPEHNLGFYVATNTLNGLPFQLEDAFINHYYPLEQKKLPNPPTDSKERAEKYVGTYRQYHDVSKSYITKVFSLFMDDCEFKIKNNGDGTLTMKGVSIDKKNISTKLVEVKPQLFKRQDNSQYVAFRKNENGHITYLFSGSEPQESFEKIKWYESQGFNLCLLAISLVVFTLTCLVCFSKFIMRIIKGKKVSYSKGEGLAKLSSVLVCFVNLVSTVGIFGILIHVGFDMNYGLPNIFNVLLFGLIVASILAMGNVFVTAIVWKKKYFTRVERIYYTFVTIISIAFIWFLSCWNMLGFKL